MRRRQRRVICACGAIPAPGLNPDGIPRRPWFKHILYGARFTYAHLELPGLTEAVEAKDWPTAKQQAEILERALSRNTQLIDDLNASLKDTSAKN